MSKVICDKCKEEFIIELKMENIKGDIRRVYFICPKCGEKYTCYYLTNRIENMQKNTKKLLEKFLEGKGRYEEYLLSKKRTETEMKRIENIVMNL
ncbi:hypothetical protein ACSXBO_07355 [Clostridium perfringens]